jgi:site-specific recombinase XerC
MRKTQFLAIAEQKLALCHSASTNTTYLVAFRLFLEWCARRKLKAVPATPAVLSAYIASLAKLNYKRSTIQFRLSAIGQVHLSLGFLAPNRSLEVRRTWRGIRRAHAARVDSAKPLTIEALRKIINILPNDLRGLRDRAILLVGFAGALTQTDLQLLTRRMITFDEFMILNLAGTRHRKVFIGPGLHPATCPVRAMQDWLEVANISKGPVFRSITVHGRLDSPLGNSSLTYILRRRCVEAGLESGDYRIQSLRSGFYLSASENNVDIELIARHAGITDVVGLKKKHLDRRHGWIDDVRSIDSDESTYRVRRFD